MLFQPQLLAKAAVLFQEALQSGHRPSEYTVNALIECFGRHKQFDRVMQVYHTMRQVRFFYYIVIYRACCSSLVSTLGLTNMNRRMWRRRLL
jgi:pentatricopeptide repeat protein